VTLVDQTVLRAPDGRRWVIQTVSAGGGYRTTARLTGCDLTPAGTRTAATPDEARRAHSQLVDKIRKDGALE
jgi:hypothetical protein